MTDQPENREGSASHAPISSPCHTGDLGQQRDDLARTVGELLARHWLRQRNDDPRTNLLSLRTNRAPGSPEPG